jgi:arylformamidase
MPMNHALPSHWTPDWLDNHYNNRAHVPAAVQHLAQWSERSAQARRVLPNVLDVPYGDGNSERLDVFLPLPGTVPDGALAPVFFFVHGGYWRSLSKADHSFVAASLVARGVCVVVPDYALCPGTQAAPVRVGDIARQMEQAVAWTWQHIAQWGGDSARITVGGHSAGGHLAAHLLARHWPALCPGAPVDVVRNAVSISGLYELESVRRTPFLQASLHLSEAEVAALSPLTHPPAWTAALWGNAADPIANSIAKNGVLISVAGGLETEPFLWHNQAIRTAWGAQQVPVCEVLPGLHHFSMVEALAQPQSRLLELVQALLR